MEGLGKGFSFGIGGGVKGDLHGSGAGFAGNLSTMGISGGLNEEISGSNEGTPEIGGAKEVLRLLSQFLLKELGKENLGNGNIGLGQDKRNWVSWDEKYFRRLEKFSGDSAKYRGWFLIW